MGFDKEMAYSEVESTIEDCGESVRGAGEEKNYTQKSSDESLRDCDCFICLKDVCMIPLALLALVLFAVIFCSVVSLITWPVMWIFGNL